MQDDRPPAGLLTAGRWCSGPSATGAPRLSSSCRASLKPTHGEACRSLEHKVGFCLAIWELSVGGSTSYTGLHSVLPGREAGAGEPGLEYWCSEDCWGAINASAELAHPALLFLPLRYQHYQQLVAGFIFDSAPGFMRTSAARLVLDTALPPGLTRAAAQAAFTVVSWIQPLDGARQQRYW